jgi:hypothetical protein
MPRLNLIAFGLVLLLMYITPGTPVSLPFVLPSRPFLSRRQNGNSDAQGDLYGIGIRTGAYLQILGMLLSCVRSHKRTRAGIKLLSSAICVSLLMSLTILLSRRKISPCEAWLIFSLTNAYGAPKGPAINSTSRKSGGVAVLFSAISTIWQDILLMWFFVTVINELPALGTADQVWLFAPVNIFGGFRFVMIIYASFSCAMLPAELACWFSLTSKRFKEWAEGHSGEVDEDEDQDHYHRSRRGASRRWGETMLAFADFLVRLEQSHFSQAIQKFAINICWAQLMTRTVDKFKPFNRQMDGPRRNDYIEKTVRLTLCAWGLVILILTIAGVEMIIDYNQLSPQNDLTRPGQIIPFMLGIITVMEGAASAAMPAPLDTRSRDVILEPRRRSNMTEPEGTIPIISMLKHEG